MKKNILFSLASIAFLWAVWLIAYACVGNGYILPSVAETFSAMGKLLTGAAFWRAFLNTLLRTLAAFGVSFLFGVGLAILARLCSPVRAFLAPVISLLRTVPTMAVVLLLLLWTSPALAPVVVSVLVLFPAIYAAAMASLNEIYENYGALTRVFNVGTGRKVFKMYLPLAAPSLILQSGAVLSLGIKIAVSGEVLSSTYQSLGGLMQNAKMFAEIPTLLALTLLTVVLGFALEGACFGAYKIIVRWRQ